MSDDLTKLSPQALLAYYLPDERDDEPMELIIKHNGMLDQLALATNSLIVDLTGGFAIAYVKKDQIMALLSYPQVIYAELSIPYTSNQ